MTSKSWAPHCPCSPSTPARLSDGTICSEARGTSRSTLGTGESHPRNISARMGEAHDEALLDQFSRSNRDDRNRRRRAMRRVGRLAAGDDHIDVQGDELGGGRRQPVEVPVGEAPLDQNGLPLDISNIAETEGIVAEDLPLRSAELASSVPILGSRCASSARAASGESAAGARRRVLRVFSSDHLVGGGELCRRDVWIQPARHRTGRTNSRGAMIAPSSFLPLPQPSRQNLARVIAGAIAACLRGSGRVGTSRIGRTRAYRQGPLTCRLATFAVAGLQR